MVEFANQVREFIKESPSTAVPIMFAFWMAIWWVICTVILRWREPVVWGDFGKLLQQTLQDTKNWKWWTVACKSSIFYESNGQLIICCDNNKFSINHNITDTYLSKDEKKELKKLVKNIFKILEERDEQAERELKRKQQQQLLDDLATLNKKPEEKQKSNIVMRTASGHFISLTDMPHYPISKETEVAVQVELSNGEKLILDELSDASLWRYSLDHIKEKKIYMGERRVVKTNKVSYCLLSSRFYQIDENKAIEIGISPKNRDIFIKMIYKKILPTLK
jgi:hypothetical protein